MKASEQVSVAFKNPVSGERVEFKITLDIPESGKEFTELGLGTKVEWDSLARTQYVTNRRNEARREEVDKIVGKVPGVRSLAAALKDKGMSVEDALKQLGLSQ